MVDIEREVPGKTADAIWAKPIQAACGNDVSSIRNVRGLRHNASTNHMMTPPMNSAHAITQRFSTLGPISFVNRNDGTAVITKALRVRPTGSGNRSRLTLKPRGRVARNDRC